MLEVAEVMFANDAEGARVPAVEAFDYADSNRYSEPRAVRLSDGRREKASGVWDWRIGALASVHSISSAIYRVRVPQ